MKDDRVVPALQLQGGGWCSARVDPPQCSRPRVASLVAAPNAPVDPGPSIVPVFGRTGALRRLSRAVGGAEICEPADEASASRAEHSIASSPHPKPASWRSQAGRALV